MRGLLIGVVLMAVTAAPRREWPLGRPATVCMSSSGCSGVTGVQVAGDHVAASSESVGAGDAYGKVTVIDTFRRNGGIACDTARLPDRGGVVDAFVLTTRGSVTCALLGSRRQIWGQGTLFDEGFGIDTASLALRGETLVWRHDGVERIAPAP